MIRVRVYDNGGETADRYTIVPIAKTWQERNGLRMMLGCSSYPNHPQGFSMFCQGQDGSHLGKRIALSMLPENVRAHVIARLAE